MDYDIVVIGGGVNGAGVLQAGAAAGHRCLLIERAGLASGTSSRSSKLIHGGLRYLESGQFRLVRESLRERTVMLRTAAELVQLKTFYIPVYRSTRRRPWQLRAGLLLYAMLGGFGPATRFGSVPRREWDRLDGLRTNDLDAVIWYQDGQTDDRLLTESIVRSARSLGAELAMPGDFRGARLLEDGVQIRYDLGGELRECRARVLINAGGPWATRIARSIEPPLEIPPVELVQGTHIVVPIGVGAGIYYVESPTDGRAVFVMPWHGMTMIGTTETPYDGDPADVRPLAGEEEYLLTVARHYFPAFANLSRVDIVERFAGLRVLPSGPSAAFDRSRETMLVADRPKAPRVLGIYGGKLTTWRATATQALAQVRGSLARREPVAATDQLVLRRH